MQELERVKKLGDHALIEELVRSARRDRELTVRVLAELGEVHARGLYRDLGFSTMFDYAMRKLGMSEAEASLRLRAARLGRKFPIALEMLGRSELNLTTLSLLAPLLRPDTLHLLDEARFKSKQRVLELIAKHAPKPDVPDSIRKLPRPSARASHVQMTEQPSTRARDNQRALLLSPAPGVAYDSAAISPACGNACDLASLSPSPENTRNLEALWPAPIGEQNAAVLSRENTRDQTPALFPPASEETAGLAPHALTPAARRSDTDLPLSADRHRIIFTASQRVRDLIEQARHLRRHRYPTRDLERLFERALELLVVDELRRRLGHAQRPRTLAAFAQTDEKRTTRTVTRAEGTRTTPKSGNGDEARTSRAPTRADESRATGEPSQAVESRTSREASRLEELRTPLEPSRMTQTQTTLNADNTDETRKAPNAAEPKTRSRHIPHAVRRQVWARDAGRCCFRAADNVRCEARSPLEFHHVVPFARAGAHNADNIVLLCRAHNTLLAERDYGREFIQARIQASNHAVVAQP